jgi:urease accessory protein
VSVEAGGALFALLRFASPALPIGSFAYSRGLEYAVHAGWVHDEASAGDWILGLIEHVGGELDAPLYVRLHEAFVREDLAAVAHWNELAYASRESAELRLEDSQLGAAFMRLLREAGVGAAAPWCGREDVAYATGFALAMTAHGAPLTAALGAFLWAQGDTQTSAAVRLVPLGQTAGQRIASRLAASLPRIASRALEVLDDDIGGFAPALALGSALHETQYTRLFRS